MLWALYEEAHMASPRGKNTGQPSANGQLGTNVLHPATQQGIESCQ